MKKDRTLEIQYYDWRLIAWFTSETRDRLDDFGRGIYRELLDHCYAQGSFPDNEEWICRKCATTLRRLHAVWPVIEKHFPKTSSGTHRHNILSDIFRKRTFDYLKRQSDTRKFAIAKARESKQMEKVASRLAQREPQVRPNQRTNEGTNGINERTNERSGAKPPPLFVFPRTAQAVQVRFPSADLVLVGRIVDAATRAFVSEVRPKIPVPGDAEFAEAVEAAAKASGGKQTSAALFLRTVPAIVASWAKYGRNGAHAGTSVYKSTEDLEHAMGMGMQNDS